MAEEKKQRLAQENQQSEVANYFSSLPDEEKRKMIIEAMNKVDPGPIGKAWIQFQKDVEAIRNQQNFSNSGPNRDILVWCDKAIDAIQLEDFDVFNYLLQQLARDHPECLYNLHYPDLNEPGLKAEDIEGLSKFIKPKDRTLPWVSQ